MTDRAEAIRRMSRSAFGQDYKLELMVAIARSEDGLVTLTDLAATLRLGPSQIQQSLKSLVALGLLASMPHGDSRRKFLLRNPSTGWAWAEELAAMAEERSRAPAPDRAPGEHS